MTPADARRAARAACQPRISYPPELPVSLRHDDLLGAIRDNQVVVVAGETGSGKTTQLPKMCLELGRGLDGMIGHTQPRRIAARAVAERLAEELGADVGAGVGYAVRFNDRVGPSTRVKVMTDGILLAEIRRDRLLRAYDTIIVDEAHERSLNIDFLLGYLVSLLPRRPDLKVLITSATIDTERFAAHFSAPVVEVSGRSYPVEIVYRPPGGASGGPSDGRWPNGGEAPAPATGTTDAGDIGAEDVNAEDVNAEDVNAVICSTVGELVGRGPGDILVFLAGERDIRDAAEALRQWSEAGRAEPLEVLPLYGRLSAADQHRVFKAHGGRRVVLATNVAETSLTVPGIRFVVDTGLARVSRYSHRTKVQRLPIEAVSQASADQRAGRCGRLGPGVCVRLYSEEDYAARPRFTDPEILRTNLASVMLQMEALRLGSMEEFPFLDPPDRRSVTDGRALLEELGAFSVDGATTRLTRVGRRLAELPVDPRLGRMLIEAEGRACLHEVTVIVAALSIQDPRERPTDPAGAAEAAALHRRFDVAGSDFLGLLRLWDHLAALQAELSGNAFRRRCRAEYLHVLRIREWQDLVSQIRQVHRSRGMRHNREPAAAEAVHRALLAGLLSHVGMRESARGDYRGARNSRWTIGRESQLARRPPAWAMAATLVETDRIRARTAARIEPAWAEQAAPHLIKRAYSEPWWDRRRGEAMVEERLTLYGLPVVDGRPAALARIDADEARSLFIERALVERDWVARVAPLDRRADMEAQVAALEERVRRRDLLAPPEALYEFYDRILPTTVTGGGRFLKWWRGQAGEPSDPLEVPLSVLVDRRGGPVDLAGYPERWRQGDVDLELRYRYAPGAPDDGVTVRVPLLALSRLDGAGFDWHVAGFRPELVTSLIRLAPKAVRRALGPAPDAARRFLAERGPADGPLLVVLSTWAAATTGELSVAGAWDSSALPDHLHPAFEVFDEGAVVAFGRDLEELRHALRSRIRVAVARAVPGIERHGARTWVFGDIPRLVERGLVRAYPALVDEGESVGVAVFDVASEQAASAWQGTRRLLRLAVPIPEAHLQRRLTNETKLAVARSGATLLGLLDDCADAVADQIIVARGGPAYEAAVFEAMVADATRALGDRVARLATIAGGVLATADLVRSRAGRLVDTNASVARAAQDVADQVDRLVGPGFVSRTGPGRLRHLLRYLDAAGRRLERLPGDARRDAERQVVLDRVEAAYERLLDRYVAPGAGPVPAGVAAVRWMIEELRVSLWAQTLGTPEPVSEPRIMRAIDALAG